MKERLLLVSVFCLLAGAPLMAQTGPAGQLIVSEPGLKVRSHVDWSGASLEVDATRALDPSTAALPRAKADAQADIESHLDAYLIEALARVTVDSSHTYGQLLANNPDLFRKVTDLVGGAEQSAMFLSQDFSHLSAQYSLPLFGPTGIASPLYPSRAVPIPRRLGWVPTRPFTGLVIYAKGKLPAVGANTFQEARPAVFPRVFDEQMDLVLDKGMCDPDALSRWGMVGYATSLDDPVLLTRAGELPLQLVARAVFGDNATDLVIPTEGAMQLLTLSANIQLLREGKIVIVYDSLD